MIITYYGKQFFKISHGDLTIAINPPAKESKVLDKPVRFGSNVVLVTTNHIDYNGVDQVTHGETVPFIVSGPGEYEIGGTFIKGAMTETVIDNKKYVNTSYSFAVDGINLCFLGVCSNEKELIKVKDILGEVDVLFLPIGGGSVFGAQEAEKVSLGFEPKIVIPMDYGTDMGPKVLEAYLKESGTEKSTPVPKLVLKKKDLDGKDGEVIVLEKE